MDRLPLHKRLSAGDAGWCLRANRWAGHGGCRGYFACVSRLGDGVFWYALMAAMVLFDGLQGLQASLHLAATGVMALSLYTLLKRWTKRPRPCADRRPGQAGQDRGPVDAGRGVGPWRRSDGGRHAHGRRE